jgi:hypothetical protein
MRRIVEQYKQKRAREKFMPHARRQGKGTTQKAAIAALVLILAASAALSLRGRGSETDAFVAAVRENRMDALDLIARASQARRLVFLADVPSAATPKRLAAAAVERLAKGSGLDVVGLEIDAAEQPWIDRYLSTPEEDASLLMARPRLVHESEGVARDYAEILRAVRRMNDQLGADRRIRVVALDPAGWPPAGGESPSAAAQKFGQRDAAMANALRPVLESGPKSRALIFVGGLHALKSGSGTVQTGGTRNVETEWLAGRLGQVYPQDVFTILVDATPSRISSATVAAYRGTAAGPILRDAGIPTGTALLVTDDFDFMRSPIRVTDKPGIQFGLSPQDLTFSAIADGYIYLGS